MASVALMDARSIAATAVNGGLLTPATEIDVPRCRPPYAFDTQVYDHRVYRGFGNAHTEESCVSGRTSPTGRRWIRSRRICCSRWPPSSTIP